MMKVRNQPKLRRVPLIEVIRSSGEEMWRIDAYQIPYYSRGIEEEKRTHPRFADWYKWFKKLVGLPVYKKTHCMFYRFCYSFVFNVLLYSYVIFLLHMFINTCNVFSYIQANRLISLYNIYIWWTAGPYKFILTFH
jgi:hypothetical protein